MQGFGAAVRDCQVQRNYSSLMPADHSQTDQLTPKPNLAATYRTAHQHRLMLLTSLRGEVPTRGEFCRIMSVETLAPNLWITVGFFDGSTRRLRPEKIRMATAEEESLAEGLSAHESVR